MNYKICMLRECKNCKYEINCFKEKENEHSKNKHRKIKTSRIQSKKRSLQPEDEEWKKIQRSIEEFGYVDPIIVNKDMTVIGGHQRLKVLKTLGYTEIECNVVELDKVKEKALNVALNKISGEWDYDKLEDLLLELKEADIDLLLTGFDNEEIEKLLKESEEIINDNEEVDLSEFKDDKFQCQCPKCGFMFDIKK